MINETNPKTTVLLLFGGESPEHSVSIVSAQNIYTAFDLHTIIPLLCYIDRKGRWWHVDSIAGHKNATIPITPIPGTSSVKIGTQIQQIDVIFPALHGKNGEDGTIQGLATLLHAPIVGCGVDGSAICIDKILTKQLLEAFGIKGTPFTTHRLGQPSPSFAALTKELGNTLFIKPARQGSSVGVSKVTSKEELRRGIKDALQYDTDILIETAIEDAREVEVAVLGPNQNPQASVVGEVIPDRDFYSYESKYDSNSTSALVIPASLEPRLAKKIQDVAIQAYRILRCQGLARIDFFLGKNNVLYLNEVNTMPGFTNISMYPKLWEASGLPYKQLIATLIQNALIRGREL